jgi:NCAIR mutase (PurE)-related protein
MNQLTVTTTERAYRALVVAAEANGLTVEALASEAIQQVGISYAEIFRVGVMTSAAFVRRFKIDEYAGILAAAGQNTVVALLVGELLQAPYVALDDERLRPGLEALVQAGLLDADRIAAILDYNTPI